MRISKIEIDNFMAFGRAVWTSSSEVDQMVLIDGEIDGTKANNGAGKSSFGEAFFWCLSGRTVRDVRVADIPRRGCDAVHVLVEVLYLGETWVFSRGWSAKTKFVSIIDPNGEREEFHDVAQGTARIEEIIGMSFDHLELCIFFGRRYRSFSRMSAADRADLLTNLLDVGRYEEARAEAVAEVTATRTDLKAHQAVHKRLSREIDESWEQREALAERLEKREEKLQEAISQIDAELEELGTMDGPGTDPLELEIDVADERLEEYEATANEARDLAKEMHADLAVKQKEIERIERLIETDRCPLCHSDIEHDHSSFKRELRKLVQEERDLREEYDSLVIDAEAAEERADEQKAKLKATQREIRERERAYQEYKSTRTHLEQSRKVAERDEDATRLDERLTSIEQHIKKQEKEKEKVEEEIDVAEYDQWLAKFWAVGFQNIRFMLFARAGEVMRDLMEATLLRTGFEFDELTVSTFRDAARNEKRPHIDVAIRRGKHTLSLASLSEGETQKIDLAAYLAISEFVQRMYGVEIDLRILDEPLHGIDDVSKVGVFECLASMHEYAQRFVIDHDAHFADRFTDRLTVTKIDGVAYLEAVT